MAFHIDINVAVRRAAVLDRINFSADIPLRSSLTLTAQAGEKIPHAVMVATLITSFFALVTVIGQGIRARARARRASND